MNFLRNIVIYLYKRLGCQKYEKNFCIPETVNIDCTISTPQFKDGKVHSMCIQKGTFYRDTLIFHPYNSITGHDVYFHSYEDFVKSVVSIL